MTHAQRTLISGIVLVLCVLVTNVAALHGASYQGPGAGGATSGPATGTGAPTTGQGSWSDWWELNRGSFLDLKRHLYSAAVATGSEEFFLGHGVRAGLPATLRPTQAQIEQIVVPALLRALEREESVDIVTGALMALAKIGGNREEAGRGDLARILAEHLDDGSQEVRETAALALGALGDAAARAALTSLLRDDSSGRSLVGKTRVEDRTRAFAAFGLGLYGRRCTNPVLRAEVARELAAVLKRGPRATPDLEVACVTALGLVGHLPQVLHRPHDTGDTDAQPAVAAAPTASTVEVERRVVLLLGILDDGHRHKFVRAHVPAALARLHEELQPDARALRELIRARLLARIELRTKDERVVVQGALLALGEIGSADDAEIRAALFAVHANAAGTGERQFALVALARAGGRGVGAGAAEGSREVTKLLVKSLGNGPQARRAWAALALGVQAHRMRSSGRAPSTAAVQALRATLAKATEPELVAAAAVGLGLTGDSESAKLLLKKLEQVSVDSARGSICEGLGLLGAREAIETLQGVVADSEFRPFLLARASVALALLGGADAVPLLIEMLGSARSLAGQAGIAAALGTIGDVRSLPPLAAFLGDARKTTTARAFAAVALGVASDTAPLPWNEPLRVGVQYRAATVTLIGGTGRGVLEIL